MSRNNEKNETKNDAIQIPELDEEDKQTSEGEKNLEWARGVVEYYNNGVVHRANSLGITVQVLKEREGGSQGIRVIAAYDEEPCLTYLAMLKHTFEFAGFFVQLSPYLVLCKRTPNPSESPFYYDEKKPVEEEEEKETIEPETSKHNPTNIGMEVV